MVKEKEPQNYLVVRRLAAWLGAVVFLSASGAAANADLQQPSSSSTAGQTPKALSLHPCGPDELAVPRISRALQCGELRVPENPADPQGRQIDLQVARLPAIAANSQPDPVVLLAGGPGQAATEMLPHLWPLIARLNRQRDILLIDQRGTGQSAPLDCELPEADPLLAAEQALAAQTQSLRDCLADLQTHAELRFYTTPYAVADFEQVRQALGYQQINLWGISYGTRVALDYMRRHPTVVRSAVLDGVAPLALQLPAHLTEDANRALTRLLAHCAQRPQCAEEYGDLSANLSQLIDDLNQSPPTIELTDPLTETTSPVQLTGTVLSGYLRLALYARELGPLLPVTIQRLTQGDYRMLASLISAAAQSNASISVGLHYSVLCSEDWPQIQTDKVDVQSDIHEGPLSLDALDAMAAVCEFWPRGELPADYPAPVSAQQPVLLLSGTWDPVTPPRWGEQVAQQLPNSRHLVVAGAHHGVSLQGCLPTVINDFISAADHQNLATSCVDNIAPLPPFVSPAGPSMTAEPTVGGADD